MYAPRTAAMPYEQVNLFLARNSDGTMRLVSSVPREDMSDAALQWGDGSGQSMLIEGPSRLLELPLEVMSNIIHQVKLSFARE